MSFGPVIPPAFVVYIPVLFPTEERPWDITLVVLAVGYVDKI